MSGPPGHLTVSRLLVVTYQVLATTIPNTSTGGEKERRAGKHREREREREERKEQRD